ncbi:MAG: NAD(P)-binding domain-containing protein, partial [Legionellales bacterium]
MAKIGFIGLGHMGLPMAINLVKAGHHVLGYDLRPSAVERFSKAGGLTAKHLQDIGNDQEIVITMLQKGDQVLKVCHGSGGLMGSLKK